MEVLKDVVNFGNSYNLSVWLENRQDEVAIVQLSNLMSEWSGFIQWLFSKQQLCWLVLENVCCKAYIKEPLEATERYLLNEIGILGLSSCGNKQEIGFL